VAEGFGFDKALSWGGDTNADLNFFYIPGGKKLTEAFVGFAFQPKETTKPNTSIMAFWNTTESEPQVELRLIHGRHLVCFNDQFVRMTDTVVMNALTPGKWHYIEIRMVHHNTTGIVEIKINGQQVLNATSQDTTGHSGVDFFDSIRFYGGEASSTTVESEQYLIDDVYLLDTTGSVNTTFLGPIKIEPLLPTAEGATINFTPSAGTDNSANVDENPRNDDTDYNSSADTASNKDLFATANLSDVTGNIKGVQVTSQCRSTAGLPVGMQSIVAEGTPTQGTGSVVEVGSDNKFTAVQHIFEINPDTSAAWTAAEVDGMEIGYEID
jgi:hypothetical protein